MTEQEGSLTEVVGRMFYYESASKNPTKDPREARDYLYKELDRLGAFVTDGVTTQDFERLNQRLGKFSGVKKERIRSEISVLSVKVAKGEIGEGNAIALITDPRTTETVVTRVPSRK